MQGTVIPRDCVSKGKYFQGGTLPSGLICKGINLQGIPVSKAQYARLNLQVPKFKPLHLSFAAKLRRQLKVNLLYQSQDKGPPILLYNY